VVLKRVEETRKSVRILVVDDYEPWRDFIANTLKKEPGWEVVGKVSDGSAAVQRAHQLKPDLILLDIGLPTLNGIDAARRIRTQDPQAKILFLSENRSRDVAEEALRSGGNGFVLKSDAAGDLVLAVKAVLHGKRFVSASLTGMSGDCPDPRFGYRPFTNNFIAVTPPLKRHEAGFYSDDQRLLEHLTQFVGAALKSGGAAMVAATESHRDALTPRLQSYCVDIGAAIEQGRYVALDAAEALAAFMRNGMPDPVRFVKLFDQLILTAEEASSTKHPRVVIFGECVNLLWAEGNAEAAIQVEKLGNQLIKAYDVDILCAYFPPGVAGGMDEPTFQRICAEHSTVYDH
jgi:CheY-like chemotaxis protein